MKILSEIVVGFKGVYGVIEIYICIYISKYEHYTFANHQEYLQLSCTLITIVLYYLMIIDIMTNFSIDRKLQEVKVIPDTHH